MNYAVIPTGNRPAEYKNVIDWCDKQGIHTITIATSSQAAAYAVGQTISHTNDFNISKWWNLGLAAAYKANAEHVYVLNDDVILPDYWQALICEALDNGYSGASGERGKGLITGYAFGLHSKSRIYADERLVWWYGDDDIQRQCENAGGFAIIPGLPAENLYGNSSYITFKEQIERDAVYYHQKWAL